MKILVAGSRGFDQKLLLYKECDRILYRQPWDKAELLHHVQGIVGDAEGADELAREWFFERQLTYQIFHADWQTYGKSAGPRRNREMVIEALKDLGGCEALLFMPEGRDTPGTYNTWQLCLAKGIKTHLVRF